jgi:hypothetical protein
MGNFLEELIFLSSTCISQILEIIVYHFSIFSLLFYIPCSIFKVPIIVVHTCNPSPGEVEVGGS